MKALVFDLDGTLVDTKHDMLDAGNLVFENQGWTTRLEGFSGLQTAVPVSYTHLTLPTTVIV